jgi:SH3-like domain-containing protein
MGQISRPCFLAGRKTEEIRLGRGRKPAVRFRPAIPAFLRYSVGNPVKSARQSFSGYWWLLALASVLCLAGCDRGDGRGREIVYVSAPQVALRDQVAAVYNKTGMVKNGDRLEVLEHDRRYVKVRTSGGVEGWMEQRYLTTQQVYDGFQKLVQEGHNVPVQATATTRNDTNLHLEPGRETEHLYQLNSGSKVSVLKRATADKNALPAPKPAPPPKTPVSRGHAAKTAPPPPPVNPTPAIPAQKTAEPFLEDWWLVRDAQGKVGWVLGRMIDLDVPLEIAQYAEGQRLIAFVILDEVTDGDKKVPQYLVLMSEPKDGMPYDYDQIRVFTWNVRKHRYETAYRERKLNGILPVTASHEDFGKEGTLPTFALHVKDDSGALTERKYKMNTPIVRRVLAPGEQKETAPAVTRKRRRR